MQPLTRQTGKFGVRVYEVNEFGTVDTVRALNAQKGGEERAAIAAEAAEVFAAASAAAAEKAAMLAAAPHVRAGEWDESRHAYGHDVRDSTGAPVAVVSAYTWVEGNGTRALEARQVGQFVATRDGRIVSGQLVNASAHSVAWSFDGRYDTPATATSEWLPADAMLAGEGQYEPHVAALWDGLLGDAADAIELSRRNAARAAKAAKAPKAAEAQASPFAALAALRCAA